MYKCREVTSRRQGGFLDVVHHRHHRHTERHKHKAISLDGSIWVISVCFGVRKSIISVHNGFRFHFCSSPDLIHLEGRRVVVGLHRKYQKDIGDGMCSLFFPLSSIVSHLGTIRHCQDKFRIPCAVLKRITSLYIIFVCVCFSI